MSSLVSLQNKVYICLCVSMQVYVHVEAHMYHTHVCTYMWRPENISCDSMGATYLVCSLAWNSLCRQGCPTKKVPQSWDYRQFWRLNSGPHTNEASAYLSELSPNPKAYCLILTLTVFLLPVWCVTPPPLHCILYVGCLPACLCTTCMLCPRRPDGHQMPWDWSYRWL